MNLARFNNLFMSCVRQLRFKIYEIQFKNHTFCGRPHLPLTPSPVRMCPLLADPSPHTIRFCFISLNVDKNGKTQKLENYAYDP